jgi:anhydro-N-acetylmuramic acid kinase
MAAGAHVAIGLISGTSMDGIDAAVVETDGERVLSRGAWATTPYEPALRERLLAVAADPRAAAEDDLSDLEDAVTDANAQAVEALLAEARLDRRAVRVVGLHGQTVLHAPERRFTRQLGDGARLARALGIEVVDRFRNADVAAGGQGAPFAPLYHRALARDLPGPLAVLNLGGVGNVTWIDGDRILAFDTGPASAMIDDWVKPRTGQPFDAGGAIAARGSVHADRLARLLDHPYFALPAPKSLDRNAFPAAPVEGLSLEDGAATLAAFTVATVLLSSRLLPTRPVRWLVTGGGRHNAHFMSRLAEELGVPVEPVEAVGWQGDALEAQCFGFLAVRSLMGLPLSEPTTTGVPAPMPGGVRHPPPAA